MGKEMDYIEVLGNRLAGDILKSIIRRENPPQKSESLCNAIDAHEKYELSQLAGYAFQQMQIEELKQQLDVWRFLYGW